jgi:predicted oxidoreductase
MSPKPVTTAPLSADGPALSAIVAGVWRMAEWGLSPAQRLSWVHAALDLGISTFDHADIYGNYSCEALFGEALALHPGLRQRMQLVGKVGICLVSSERPAHRLKHYDTSAAHVHASVERTLKNLGTDHLDVLLVHRPDALMDPLALAESFHALRKEGKVLHFGVSNHTPSQFALLHQHIPLVTNQIELSPLQLGALTDGTLDQAMALGLRPMAWSPLAGGRLFTGQDAAAQRVRELLGRMALERGVAPATLAYAWLLRHPSRPLPITGSGRVQALHEAAQALAVQLDRQAWWEIWQAGAGHEVA